MWEHQKPEVAWPSLFTMYGWLEMLKFLSPNMCSDRCREWYVHVSWPFEIACRLGFGVLLGLQRGYPQLLSVRCWTVPILWPDQEAWSHGVEWTMGRIKFWWCPTSPTILIRVILRPTLVICICGDKLYDILGQIHLTPAATPSHPIGLLQLFFPLKGCFYHTLSGQEIQDAVKLKRRVHQS